MKILEDNGRSIVQALDDERIVSIMVTDKGLEITESCDSYFGTTLSPEQVDRLIAELVDLRKLLNGALKP